MGFLGLFKKKQQSGFEFPTGSDLEMPPPPPSMEETSSGSTQSDVKKENTGMEKLQPIDSSDTSPDNSPSDIGNELPPLEQDLPPHPDDGWAHHEDDEKAEGDDAAKQEPESGQPSQDQTSQTQPGELEAPVKPEAAEEDEKQLDDMPMGGEAKAEEKTEESDADHGDDDVMDFADHNGHEEENSHDDTIDFADHDDEEHEVHQVPKPMVPAPRRVVQEKFIIFEEFQSLLKKIGKARALVKVSEGSLAEINELREREDKEFDKWHKQAGDALKKLTQIDKLIFER